MRRFVLALVAVPAVAAADINYTLSPQPESASVAVTVQPDQAGTSETFRIPAWCPGFYSLRNYQEAIYDVVATNAAGRSLPLESVDARGWKVSNPTRGTIIFSYKVKGNDDGLGFFGVNVRSDKAFVNGPAAFMYVEGKKEEPTKLKVNLPPKWDIATGMTSNEVGTYTAGGYDELLDHPIQMGAMTRRSFKVGDYDFEVVFVAATNDIRPKVDEQVEVLKKVSAPPIALFGGAPFKRYVYILHLTNAGFLGGLEHRGSTTIAMPNTTNLDLTTLAAHEFFHTWNVKNLRPAVLGPFDYTKEVRTGNLWFAEGVTDYYANRVAYRSGLRDAAWFYRVMGNEIAHLQSSETRRSISLEDACKQTWESGGFGFKDLDYYNKGSIAGFVFDAAIRGVSDKSLDDVMRSLYAKYRLPNAGYEEDGLRREINAISGTDLSGLYSMVVRSTDEVPYETLQQIGLRVALPGTAVRSAGFTTIQNRITTVNDAASTAGFKVGDQVVGTAGDAVTILRDGQTQTIAGTWTTVTPKQVAVEEDPAATADQRKRLADFLARP